MIDAVAVQVLDVLLVEDAPGDVLLAKEAFEQSAISSQLHVTARRLRYHTTAGPPEPDGGRTETRRRSALTAAGSPAGCSALGNPRAGVTA